MHIKVISLQGSTPGTRRSLKMVHFGQSGARPKCYLQTGLHADEIPGMLVMHHLRRRLAELEEAGKIVGEIVLVPAANPIGLGQQLSGSHIGRFCLTDGQNFNRGFPALTEGAARRLNGLLGRNAADNAHMLRGALRQELDTMPIVSEHESLKHALLGHAIDADVVLDLHCDTEAVLHVYTGTPLTDQGLELARLLGARALLVSENSGDDPFDEACSRPWWEIARKYPAFPLESACFAATVELRGAVDVAHTTAAEDAEALIEFMTLRGAIAGKAGDLPQAQCFATPLEGSEPVIAQTSGVLVFHRAVGDSVDQGDAIADVVDPDSGKLVTLLAPTSGVMYARVATRWAYPGMRLAKVAGLHATRSGHLLSP